MLALAWFVSQEARAIDVLVGVPLREDPFSAFTTEVSNGVPASADVGVRNAFRGELSAAIPFHDLGASSHWIVDVGIRQWADTFDRGADTFHVSADEPHADAGVELGSTNGADVRPYAAMGVGMIVSILTSSDWRTFAFPSPHCFLAAGAELGGPDTSALVELRVSPVLRDDTYTRETLLENGGAGFRFMPGGAAVTFSVGLRFL